MAGLLDSPYGGGGLLGNPMQAGLLNSMGNPSAGYFPTRYAVPGQPNMTDRVVGGMVRLPFAMAEGIGNTVMQANRAMPWGGNDPSAIGLDPARGTMDPSVMIPFATDVAGMATTGALAAPPVAGAAGMGIRAYHGSPHDFDRFSMDKIGTGEGAQAYGHGLYFAENEGVSRGYRDALSSHEATLEGKPFATSREYWAAFDELEKTDWRQAKVLDEFTKANGTAQDRLRELRNWHHDSPEMMAAIDRMEPRLDTKSSGRMYEVDIDASLDEFLDWDKPLSEQSPLVRQALQQIDALKQHSAILDDGTRLIDLAKSNGIQPIVPIKMQGLLKDGMDIPSAIEKMKGMSDSQSWQEQVAKLDELLNGQQIGFDKILPDQWMGAAVARGNSDISQQDLTGMLRAAGIKGIRYKDAGSRGAEGGTSNYVVFDDNTVNIIRKYGLAGLTAGGAGAAALGGSDPAAASPFPYTTGGRF